MLRAALTVLLSIALAAACVAVVMAGFRSAVPGRSFAFPRDHGKHQDFQTEWWYFVGNLDDERGHAWGFQLTFFRRSLVTEKGTRQSSWTIRDIYPAHLAITDGQGRRFFCRELLSREGPDLAAAATEQLAVHVKNWSAQQRGEDIVLKADEGDHAIDLTLSPVKTPVLHGKGGYSQKGNLEEQGSYYYSLTRMVAEGTIRFDGADHRVRGLAWMDHEFGSSVVLKNQSGWDWFSLQLDDGTELMVFHMRGQDGRAERPFGTFVPQSGNAVDLDGRRMVITPTRIWKSPQSGAQYPLSWTVEIPDEDMRLEITPILDNQERSGGRALGIVYWEGAVAVTGIRAGKQVSGRGYVELTGYVRSLGGAL